MQLPYCSASFTGLGLGLFLKLSISLAPPGHLLLPAHAWQLICMSEDSDPLIDITVRIRELSITVSGPATQASQLVSQLANHNPPTGGSVGSTLSESSYSRVDLPVSVPLTSSRRETRAEIEASFAPCPDHLCRLARQLGGSTTLGGEGRILRAWKAGQWARATIQGRSASPCRTPPLDLRSRYYVVLRANGIQEPVCFTTSHSYWRLIRSFSHNEESVSHSFPSESEARAYCAGAEVPFPTPQA